MSDQLREDPRIRGRWGEALAAGFLRKKGYNVTGMGFRTRFGEIDIIAENKRYIVFFEVKLRKNADFGEACEFVDRRKRRRIIASAKLWLIKYDSKKQPRFDIIEIYAPNGTHTKDPIINHMENAFSEE